MNKRGGWAPFLLQGPEPRPGGGIETPTMTTQHRERESERRGGMTGEEVRRRRRSATPVRTAVFRPPHWRRRARMVRERERDERRRKGRPATTTAPPPCARSPGGPPARRSHHEPKQPQPRNGRSWPAEACRNPAGRPANLEHARWVSNLFSSINRMLTLIPSELCLNPFEISELVFGLGLGRSTREEHTSVGLLVFDFGLNSS